MAFRSLGVSYSGHGWSMCLVEDGRVVRAVNLERINRIKYGSGMPRAHAEGLAEESFRSDGGAFLGNAKSKEEVIDRVAVDRVLPDMLEYVSGYRDPKQAGLDVVVRASSTLGGDHLFCPPDLLDGFFSAVPRAVQVEHHLLHAYQAFLSSPFEDAAVLTLDGQGDQLQRYDWRSVCGTLSVGRGTGIDVLAEVTEPSSIGAMYFEATMHLGFGAEQEGTTMALAPLGTDRFYRQVRDTYRLVDDGTYEVMTSGEESKFFWHVHEFARRMKNYAPARAKDDEITALHRDVAFAVQAASEEMIVHVARKLAERTGLKRLAMAGGVAMNCVANDRIVRETGVDLHVVPNAGDRGLSLGAALYGYHVALGRADRHPPESDYLGREYSESDVIEALRASTQTRHRRSNDIAREAAELIARGRIIGWVQGGAEFGPRALGHRSILADPRSTESKKRLDAEIKRRAWFRPYAPSVLETFAADYFDLDGASPYMLRAVPSKALARERVPGILHVDGSARVQTVSSTVEPLFHRLITQFHAITGVPMVLNTSFNGPGEPIVETPTDAVNALESLSLDAVVIGDYLVWPEHATL